MGGEGEAPLRRCSLSSSLLQSRRRSQPRAVGGIFWARERPNEAYLKHKERGKGPEGDDALGMALEAGAVEVALGVAMIERG